MAVIKSKEEGIYRLTLITSPPPHIHATISVDRIVHLTVTTMLPAVVWSLYLFGWQAFRVLALGMGAALLAEIFILLFRGKDLTFTDGTAVLTGMIFAFTLPPTTPSWLVLLGAFIGIVLGKHVFGGTGCNPFNPAVVGRVFVGVAFPSQVSNWIVPHTGLSMPSPLDLWFVGDRLPAYKELLLGNAGSFMGDFVGLALLLGGLVLILRGYIDWRVPLGFLGGMAIFLVLLGQDPLWHVLTGGVMLGAFYLAGDPVTNPMTPGGRLVFGIGAGLALVIMRVYGQSIDGLFFGILLMNGLSPLLNRYLRSRRRGVATCEKH